VGTTCTGGEDCGWTVPANNCPLASVYTKVEKVCRGKGRRFCYYMENSIARTSLVTLGIFVATPALFFLCAWGCNRAGSDDDESNQAGCYDDAGCKLISCTVFLILGMLGNFFGFCYMYAEYEGMKYFWIWLGALAGVVMILPCCAWRCAPDNNAGNAANRAQDGQRMLMMSLPLMSLLVAWEIDAEQARKVAEGMRPMKVWLRVVYDIPELTCTILDLYFFGGSYFAVFDLITSLLVMAYHLSFQMWFCGKALCCMMCRMMCDLREAFRDSIGAGKSESSSDRI